MKPTASCVCTVGAALFAPALALQGALVQAMEVDGWQVDMNPLFDTSRVELSPASGTSTVRPDAIIWSDDTGNSSSLHVIDESRQRSGRTRVAEDDSTIAFSMQHNNGVLFLQSAPVLRSGALMATSTLRKGEDGDPMDMAFELPFYFLESPNEGVDGLCADGNAAPTEEGCADLFIADPDDLAERFSYDGVQYEATLALLGSSFEGLSPGECGAAGAEVGCVGFQTGEHAMTQIDFSFDIKAVPLPGALLLFPSALLALGVWRRRRH